LDTPYGGASSTALARDKTVQRKIASFFGNNKRKSESHKESSVTPTSLLSVMLMKEFSEKSLKTESSITRTEKESLISPRYVNIWFAPTLKRHLFFACYTALPSLQDTPLQGANVYFHP
jgi:hypothetical protein